ncbi:MAG: sugar ABC transporter substrate-binding protein [Acidobacteria bacterium]|nr:sugar ABC transporter substrate-binding protein [Acidobacteriota bacterium]
MRIVPRLGAALVLFGGLLAGIASCSFRSGADVTVIEFWGLGREGEVVAELVPEFERLNPGIRVEVQQIPWTAAHEKLLTAHVGESLPDLAQMGNTWIPEFHLVGALENLSSRMDASDIVVQSDYFQGIWDTNLIGNDPFGIPWYVDTRVLFYRKDILQEAGFDHPPRTWSEWMRMCERLKANSDRESFYPLLLPTNEWPQPVVLALQTEAPFVSEDANAQFHDPRFLEAFDFYLEFFRRGHAPVISGSQIANLYQQFGEGEFAMFITGPWNVGELRRRLPEHLQSSWTTAPMPAPDGEPYPGASLAGGSSLVLFRGSENPDAAWKFIEFLSEPAQQARFYKLTGDLPARKSAWDVPVLAEDQEIQAFRTQLENTVALPRIPEWERIATMIFEEGELAARGRFTTEQAADRLDSRVDEVLVKRRWVMTQ